MVLGWTLREMEERDGCCAAEIARVDVLEMYVEV